VGAAFPELLQFTTVREIEAEVNSLCRVLEADSVSALNKVRTVAEGILFRLCKAHNIAWGDAEPTLERLIGPLVASGHLPKNVAIHVRTIQMNTSPGSHYQEQALSEVHVRIALSALVELIKWRYAAGKSFSDNPITPNAVGQATAQSLGGGADAAAPLEGHEHKPHAASYRPTAVLVIDVVKDTLPTKKEFGSAGQIIQDSLQASMTALQLTGVQFEYTEHGYVCTFIGDASMRVVDLINTALPDLQRRLAALAQQFKAGVDFGVANQLQNRVTNLREHFDQRRVRASLLKRAANPNQILASETVYDIFSPYYNVNFGRQRLEVDTPGRQIPAYELVPLDYTALKQGLFEYLYGRFAGARSASERSLCRILIVELHFPRKPNAQAA
jgi:hypothetical protein